MFIPESPKTTLSAYEVPELKHPNKNAVAGE